MAKSIVIVTGGSSGLGKCLTYKLLKNGFHVFIIGRDEQKLFQVKNDFSKEFGDRIEAQSFDISKEESVKAFYKNLENEDIMVSHLFNCAGVGRFGPVKENNFDKISEAIGASLIGLILMSSNCIPFMQESGGTIVNIMSTAALKGNANESIYCAAKWGARGFTESLKTEMKGSNIHVVGVYPGGMNTAFWNASCGSNPDVHRFMNPEEVAEEIVHAVLERKSMHVADLTIERN